jgi:membrane protease YdiL (CAAX protease family)
MLIFQSVFGRGLRDIRAAHLPPWVLAITIPLLFAWLMVEVGVVEEFFFRVLLQTRLEALLDSRWGGIVCSSLLFGLIHVPGLYLRPELTLEAVGAHPSLFMAIGYSIVLTSAAGLFLGVVWTRTRSFTAIVLIHAATDLLPGVVPMIQMLRK